VVWHPVNVSEMNLRPSVWMIKGHRWKAERDSALIEKKRKKERALHLQMCAKALLSSANAVSGRKTTFFVFLSTFFYEWAMGNVCVCSPPSSCMGHCVWVMICLACHRWINMPRVCVAVSTYTGWTWQEFCHSSSR